MSCLLISQESNSHSGAGESVSSLITVPKILHSLAKAAGVHKQKRRQSFHNAIRKLEKEYDAAEEEPRLGKNQKLDFHIDALFAQHEQIALVERYGLSTYSKQWTALYGGLGYTGLRRFLEESDSNLTSIMIGSKEQYLVETREGEIAGGIRLAPELEGEAPENEHTPRNPCKNTSFCMVDKDVPESIS